MLVADAAPVVLVVLVAEAVLVVPLVPVAEAAPVVLVVLVVEAISL